MRIRTAEQRIASRWIPKGSMTVKPKGLDAAIYVAEIAGIPYAVGYLGSAGKPAFNYRFKSAERRAEFVSNWIADMLAWEKRKADRAAEKKAKLAKPMGLKVGDVLYGSWGYDQTNVEFWEVTKVIGARMVEIRELCCESEETAFMQGRAVPLPGQYTDKAPLRKNVSENDSVKLYDFGCYLSKLEPKKVDGVPVGYESKSWTAYA